MVDLVDMSGPLGFGPGLISMMRMPSSAAGGPIREIVAGEYTIRLDLGPQVLAVDVPRDESGSGGEPYLSASIRKSGSAFVSAAMLVLKGKQFDDGLYAAVELAAQSGLGRFAGKRALVRGLARLLALAPASPTAEVLYAAGELGDSGIEAPPAARAGVDARKGAFLGDPIASKPLGFYGWSDELVRIFRQDRMLQSPLDDDPEGRAALIAAMLADPELTATYRATLGLFGRLTNPNTGDWIDWRQTEAGGVPSQPGLSALLPPARSREAELLIALFGDRPIPEGFSLAQAMIDRIRAGTLDTTPRPESGWYDYQTHALAALVDIDRTPEAARLDLRPEYRKMLEETFKGALALTRETHVKSLFLGGGGRGGYEMNPKVRLPIAPELPAEPLPTHSLRRANAYRFVRGVLTDAFGAEALKSMHRQTAEGPVQVNLDEELAQVEAMFAGCAAATAVALGMEPAKLPGWRADRDPAVVRAAFDAWRSGVATDPDLGRDARMMVPVAFDVQRQKVKVWAFLGWCDRPLRVGYAKPPGATVWFRGAPARPETYELLWHSQSERVAFPVAVELDVDRVLDRSEFRRLCDRHGTRRAIVWALSR